MIGKRLHELRVAKGLSLRELGQMVKLSPTLLSQVERGVTTPSLTTLRKLSGIFGESMSSLFMDSSKGPSVWISRPGERMLLRGPRGGVVYAVAMARWKCFGLFTKWVNSLWTICRTRPWKACT